MQSQLISQSRVISIPLSTDSRVRGDPKQYASGVSTAMHPPCIEAGHSRCPGQLYCHMESTHQKLNIYEQERQQRINRNRRTLEDLGLSGKSPEHQRKAPAVKKVKVFLPSKPTRRSKRISGGVEAPTQVTLGPPVCKACCRYGT